MKFKLARRRPAPTRTEPVTQPEPEALPARLGQALLLAESDSASVALRQARAPGTRTPPGPPERPGHDPRLPVTRPGPAAGPAAFKPLSTRPGASCLGPGPAREACW